MIRLSALLLLCTLYSCEAFVTRNPAFRPATSSLNLMFPSNLIATIDSDIANIPENEFAPIFLGGIFVMFGGLLSAVIVGTIVDKTDSYANLVADSYAADGFDEDFWKGLNEEERIKAQRLLESVRSKDGKVALPTKDEPKPVKKETKVDMFSDYE